MIGGGGAVSVALAPEWIFISTRTISTTTPADPQAMFFGFSKEVRFIDLSSFINVGLRLRQTRCWAFWTYAPPRRLHRKKLRPSMRASDKFRVREGTSDSPERSDLVSRGCRILAPGPEPRLK